MNNIEFNEPSIQIEHKSIKDKGIIGWLIRNGYVKDVKTANLVLIGVIIIMLAISYVALTRDSAPAVETATPITE